MDIDIGNFINTEVGHKESFDLEKDGGDIDDEVGLIKLKGEITLTNLGEEILAAFKVKTILKYTCDRCLAEFEKETAQAFERIYSFKDEEDKLKITKDSKIEVFEPIREEIILGRPMKAVCKKSCKGITKQPIYE